MATANEHIPSSLSEEAFELINSLYNGVDVVVRELAQEIAAERGSFLESDPGVIAIEEEDVQEAGVRVMNALRVLLRNGELPSEVQHILDGMEKGFDAKSK